MTGFEFTKSVERWGVFEVSVPGYSAGNPFEDYEIRGTFTSENETKTVIGFYDGGGTYKVRFMPGFEGAYQFEISGSFSDQVYSGSFEVTPAGTDNHGPVRVAPACHLAYEDGTPYISMGTTCYVWALQKEEIQEKTLKTLAEGPFNKIRFCIFPKHYIYNFNEPVSYPYEGTPCDSSNINEDNFIMFGDSSILPGNEWDFRRFNVAHFQHFDRCIQSLMALGIEADIILMHPYDRWGFSKMGTENENFYLKYAVARFAAYRNVWWSMANEYDLFFHKTIMDWESNAAVVCKYDPYRHMRSIHNCMNMYDFSRAWITHCSIQRTDVYASAELTDKWMAQYQKPVVLDEINYEGNIDNAWGNISGQEMTRRFWECSLRGGYPGHGETYQHLQDILWWSHGGELHGDSPARIRFLYDILKEVPGTYLHRVPDSWDGLCGSNDDGSCLLFYYSYFRPGFRKYAMPEGAEYEVDVIDTWEMTITPVGTYSGKFKIQLPGKEYMAVRMRRK